MELTLLPPPDLEARANQYTERSPGVHLSSIEHDILVGLDPRKYGGEGYGKEPNWAMLLAGLVFERFWDQAWLEIELESDKSIIRPGELKRDGIIGTPDAYSLIHDCPIEYKSTKKSCRYPITDARFWQYWIRLKAYSYMMGSDSGILWVWFFNGNYSFDDTDPDSGHVIRGWHARFTDVELEENWAMHVNHAKRRGMIP